MGLPTDIITDAAEKLKEAEKQRKQEQQKAERENYYKTMLAAGLGLAGNVAGIIVAVKHKSGFWGGVGWFIVLGLAGMAAGFVIGSIIDGRPKKEEQ